MTNLDIRQTALVSGVKLYMIADKLNITDSSFSRKLRKELPQTEKEKIMQIINDLAKGGN